MPFSLESLGEQSLKGFDDDVRVYRVELSSDASIPPPQQKNHSEFSQKLFNMKAAIAVCVVLIGIGVAYLLIPTTPIEGPVLVERMALPLSDKPSYSRVALRQHEQ